MAMAACDPRKVLEPHLPFCRYKVVMPEDQSAAAGQMCQHLLQHEIVAGIAHEPDIDCGRDHGRVAIAH